MDIYIARQPIFDRSYQVYAYELLYRDSLENVFKGNMSDNVATSLLLMHSYFSFGLENLVGESRAFINFDKHLINHDVAELLDHNKVTIEILETVIPDGAFLTKLKKLRDKGYSIAIDDYVIDYAYKDILDYVDLVKVDFLENTQAEIEMLAKELKKKGLKLLAEKVESKEVFKWAKDIGFDYFQGFYFEKPSIQKQVSLNQNAMIYVRLMGELNSEVPNYKKLSDIILTDVALTYKLLKLANANAKPVSPIKSITQALAVLGVKRFRRWLSLAMVENMSSPETSELLKFGLIRSSLLQNISVHSNLTKHVEELSLLGILSILDGVLKMDMDKALEALPIDQVLKDTLLKRDTIYKPAMGLCYAYEKGAFESVDDYAKALDYDINLLPDHYVEAISWTERMVRELKG